MSTSTSNVTAEPLSDTAVRLTCQINRTPQRVFDAWVTPSDLVKWFHPMPVSNCTVSELDFQVGGTYRLSVDACGHDGGGVNTVYGTYLTIDRPNRLSFTWAWEEAGPEGVTSRVTLDFLAHEGGTKLILTHEQLADRESRELHTAGWTGCLSSLANY